MVPPIRTALIGFGLGGRVFIAPFLQADPTYTLRAIVTDNRVHAAAAAGQYPRTHILPSVAKLSAHAGAIDLVILATPPETHRDLGTTALAKGVHVVVDTPFVLSAADGEALVAHARAAERLLTVYQHRRWDSDFLTVRRVIAGGELGEIREFEAHFDWWRPSGLSSWRVDDAASQAGRMLSELGFHLIDQAIQLFGPVREVQGHAAPPAKAHRVDEEARVRLLHASGVHSLLTMDPLPNMPVPRFTVRGTAATYEKWGLDPQAADIDAGMLPTHPDFGRESREEWGRIITPDAVRVVEAEHGAYGEFFRLLAEAIRGDGPLPVDPSESVEVARIIEQVSRTH